MYEFFISRRTKKHDQDICIKDDSLLPGFINQHIKKKTREHDQDICIRTIHACQDTWPRTLV